MLKKTDAKTREIAAKEALAEAAKELAQIANERELTEEEAEAISRRSA
jgi:hypothetical protein